MIASALREPFKPYQTFRNIHNKRKQRQISRMLNDLRDELYNRQFQIPLPTSWLIEQLVENALKNPYSDSTYSDRNIDWHYLLIQTLQKIIDDTQNIHCFYKREDGKTPLFPNEELMDESEVKEFADGVLLFMRNRH